MRVGLFGEGCEGWIVFSPRIIASCKLLQRGAVIGGDAASHVWPLASAGSDEYFLRDACEKRLRWSSSHGGDDARYSKRGGSCAVVVRPCCAVCLGFVENVRGFP